MRIVDKQINRTLRVILNSIAIIGILSTISIQICYADDFYWVGGTGSWSDYNNHWMKASGDTITHGRTPTFQDNVFFDENSFVSADQHVQIDILVAEVNDLDFSKITKTMTIEVIAGGRDLTVYGSMRLNDKVRSSLPSLIIAAKSKHVILNFAGVFAASRLTLANSKNIGLISGKQSICHTFEKTGTGSVSLMDSLLVSAEIQINNGTFNTNGKYIKTSNFSGSGSNTIINLMNSSIDVNFWSMYPVKTLLAGTSKISVNNPRNGHFGGADLTYNDVLLCGKISISGNNTFHELTFCEGSDIELQAGSTQQTDQLIAEGIPAKPIRIASNVFEEEAIIQQNSGNVVATSVNLEDLHAVGGATFDALNSSDLGNVQGWNIIAPVKKTFYWVGGSGSWSDYGNHWATASGGNQFHEALPTISDEIIFDENSFSSSSEVVIDLFHAYAGSMDWRGVSNQVLIKPEQNEDDQSIKPVKLHVFGSFYFSEYASSSLEYIRFKSDIKSIVDSQGRKIAGDLKFYHTGEYSIFAHNKVFSRSVNLLKEGTTIIEDSILINTSLILYDGNLIVDSSYIHVPEIIFSSGNVDITKSEIVTERWNMQSITDFKSDSSLIRVETKGNGYFYGGNFDYFDVILCGRIIVSGENTYNKLEFCPGSDIYLPANKTQIADTLVVRGDPGFPISISSATVGQLAGIKQNGGLVEGQYLYLKDSKASGATFTATETVDLGNVEGWDIISLTPHKFYWVGESGSWSEFDTHWATTSGGLTFHDRIPSALDDVFFDENSFNINAGKITIDQIKSYTKHIDFSDADNSFNISGGNEMWVFGSFIFNENGASGLGTLRFPVDTANFKIATKGNYIASSIWFEHQGNYELITENNLLAVYILLRNTGTVKLMDDLKVRSKFISSNGIFITNSHSLEVPVFDFGYNSGGGEPEMQLDIGNSDISVNSWLVGNNITFNSDSSEINVFSENGNGHFYGGGKDYNKVNAACLVYFKDNNSYNKLTITYGAKIFIAGEQTVKELVAIGTSGNPIRISGGSFRKTSGRVKNQYLILNNNKAFGGAEFIAERSVDDGGNTGWQILPADDNVDANVLYVLNGEPLCGEAIETTLSFPPELLTSFRWFKDDVLLEHDSSALVVTEEGDYYIEMTNACGTVAHSNVIEIRREGPPDVPSIYKEGITSICRNQIIDVKLDTDEQPRVHYVWMRNGEIVGYDESNIAIDTVGTYTLRLTKGECVVDSKDSVVVVIVDDVPMMQALQLVGNDTICLGDSSRFFVQYEPGTTYSWINGDTTISTQANFFDAKTEDTYSLSMENGCGVTDASGSYFLMVKQVPIQQQINIDGSDTFCFYDSVWLNVPIEEEVIYRWFVNDSNPVKNFSENKAYTDTAGNYFVEMENMCGVTITEKVEIIHIYLPIDRDIQIDGDTIICIGDSTKFSVENYPGETWVWYNHDQVLIENTERITISEPGIYSSDITNICGTTMANNMIPVEVLEIPPPTIAKDFYDHCGPGELTVKVSGGEDGDYVWRDENKQMIGGLHSEEIIVPIQVSKDYFVTLSNGYCEGPGSIVNMNVLEVPVADAGEDKTVIYGDEVMIGGEHDYPNTNYLWSPDIWMNIDTSPTPTIKPKETTIYTIEAIGQNRCSSFDEMTITVSFELVIPNTFTPNNDGTNDLWQIRNILFHPDSKVEIFNRWGTKLYEVKGYQNDWDGTYNGKNLPVDTYFYVIQFNDGTKPDKGSLTILR